MPAAPDDLAALHQHRAHHRIRRRCAIAAARQPEGEAHEMGITLSHRLNTDETQIVVRVQSVFHPWPNSASLLEQRPRELFGVEGLQIVRLLPSYDGPRRSSENKTSEPKKQSYENRHHRRHWP